MCRLCDGNHLSLTADELMDYYSYHPNNEVIDDLKKFGDSVEMDIKNLKK